MQVTTHVPVEKAIEVVSAVVIRNGRLLLTQRLENKDYPLTWECPGGKVEGNESHHDAMNRELAEEIDCYGREIAMNALWCGYVTERIFLLMYRAVLTETPKPREKQGIGWFTAEEVAGLTMTPGNNMALPAILEHLRRSRP